MVVVVVVVIIRMIILIVEWQILRNKDEEEKSLFAPSMQKKENNLPLLREALLFINVCFWLRGRRREGGGGKKVKEIDFYNNHFTEDTLHVDIADSAVSSWGGAAILIFICHRFCLQPFSSSRGWEVALYMMDSVRTLPSLSWYGWFDSSLTN